MSTKAGKTSIEDTPLSREQAKWRWRILISTYFAYAGFYLTRKVFTICKTSLASDFHVDIKMISYIWVVYLVAYMVGQFLNSFIGRKWGPRLLLLGGLGISIAINIYFGFSNSYWTFLAFMLFNGLVQACGWPGCVGGIAEWLRSRERGTVMGIWSTNYQIGNIFYKALGGYLLGVKWVWAIAFGFAQWKIALSIHDSWRFAFFGCTLAAFAIWWLVYFWQRDKPSQVGLPPLVDMEKNENRAVDASNEEQITFRQYLVLLLNPVILIMGISYFCLKFLRYSLDSWEPTFLNLLGLSKSNSAYLSMIFDVVGLPGAIFAGIALDRIFHGNWAKLCMLMGLGMVLGYIAVVSFGANPIMFAICCGFVGFMLYGPDTLICGAAAVTVAGERNAVAVAGLINGLGSVGPILQELVIGQIVGGKNGMRNANLLGLAMSIAFVTTMLVVMLMVKNAQKKYVADNVST
jgi:sugar phosphate permease